MFFLSFLSCVSFFQFRSVSGSIYYTALKYILSELFRQLVGYVEYHFKLKGDYLLCTLKSTQFHLASHISKQNLNKMFYHQIIFLNENKHESLSDFNRA